MPDTLHLLTEKIEAARKHCGLSAEGGPQVLAVSKTQGADAILPLLEAGHRLFGENRVQEAEAKWPALQTRFPDVRLHLIGPLQTNKVTESVALFDVIESLDRPKLAEALAKEMAKQSRCIPCYIQVNTGEEPQKAGVVPKDLTQFLVYCRELGLPVTGLMCIPPVEESPAPHFALLKTLADRHRLPNVSMGMSGDYEIAATLGSTEVRIGSALFGERAKGNGHRAKE